MSIVLESKNNTKRLLELNHIRKTFGGVVALDDVSFDLRYGEIHALLGENGAGKSTLIKVLAGVHTPDSGTIRIDEQDARVSSVADAEMVGIRVIHQELSVAPNMSVADNIYLGREPRKFGLLDRGRMYKDAEDLVNRLGLRQISNVYASVEKLTVAQRQLVEIARALSSEAKILVLDEPTSSLSDEEVEALFVTLSSLRSRGVGIIYISHRLEEIIRLSDRITVLRDGHSIGTQDTKQVDRRELVRWMVGRDITDHFHRPPANPGEIALEVRNLKSDRVKNVSFTLRYGEILGLAGLVGAGRSELAKVIFGIDKPGSGQILIDGNPAKINSPKDALDAGIVYVPEDRRNEGLIMNQSVAFNLALPWTNEWNAGMIPNNALKLSIIERAVKNFGIKTSDIEQRIDGLSGGNQQKVLIGRWMEHPPKILILDEPTRGVDVGAREDVFKIIGSLVEQGMAVLLISSDLEEVLNLSHRVAVYGDGHILHSGDAGDFTSESVMTLLTGVAC